MKQKWLPSNGILHNISLRCEFIDILHDAYSFGDSIFPQELAFKVNKKLKRQSR